MPNKFKSLGRTSFKRINSIKKGFKKRTAKVRSGVASARTQIIRISDRAKEASKDSPIKPQQAFFIAAMAAAGGITLYIIFKIESFENPFKGLSLDNFGIDIGVPDLGESVDKIVATAGNAIDKITGAAGDVAQEVGNAFTITGGIANKLAKPAGQIIDVGASVVDTSFRVIEEAPDLFLDFITSPKHYFEETLPKARDNYNLYLYQKNHPDEIAKEKEKRTKEFVASISKDMESSWGGHAEDEFGTSSTTAYLKKYNINTKNSH